MEIMENMVKGADGFLGNIFFCTMDGNSRILEKKLCHLLCTQREKLEKNSIFFFSSFFFNSSRPIANLFENCIFYTPKLTIYDFWIFKVPIFAHFQAILIFETPKKTQKFEFYG